MKREIEILFQLTQTFSEAKQLLDVSNASAVSEKHTVDDYYYNRKTQQFLPDENGELKECLRIRQTEDAAYYAYKEDVFLPDGSWSHSDEYELEISDADTMRSALAMQYYEPLVQIDSTKSKYMLDEYEITVEEVRDLGVFTEIELTTESSRPVDELKDEIRRKAQSLGLDCDTEIGVGKPELLLRKQDFQASHG